VLVVGVVPVAGAEAGAVALAAAVVAALAPAPVVVGALTVVEVTGALTVSVGSECEPPWWWP